MSDSKTISDPEVYPVNFMLSPRITALPQEDTAVAYFEIDGESPAILGAVIRHSSLYSMDTEPFDSSIPLARADRKVIHEVAANSTDPSQAEIILKLWTSATNFGVHDYGDLADIRQPRGDSAVIHSLYVSSGLDDFSGIEVSGVTYYPSVTVSYATEPFTDGASSSVSGTAAAGDTVNFEIAVAADSGIVWMILTMSTTWYLDQARTIPAASTPSSLPDLDGQIAVRVILADGGRFSKGGEVAAGGTATFAGVPKGESAPLVEISYLGTATDGTMFVDSTTVTLGEDGLPEQVGNDGAVYILPNPLE